MWIIFQKPNPKMPNLDQNYMYKIGEDIIIPVLLRVSGVSDVWHFGGEERELRVEFDPYRMAQLHLTYDEVIDRLSEENQNFSENSGKPQLCGSKSTNEGMI